jgi:hypothetical protein
MFLLILIRSVLKCLNIIGQKRKLAAKYRQNTSLDPDYSFSSIIVYQSSNKPIFNGIWDNCFGFMGSCYGYQLFSKKAI